MDGVMARPSAASSSGTLTSEEIQRERDKWDAWNSQKGLTRTEAKKRYIEALIDTMHRYATTPDAEELVSELEFVWNQIRNNSPSSSASSPRNSPPSRRFQQPTSGADGPMKVLSPMSEQDEAELRSQRQMEIDEDDEDEADKAITRRSDAASSSRWQRKVERAITSLSAEVAALREQISSGREWRSRVEKSWAAWFGRIALLVLKHLMADALLLVLVLLWMRRRKDQRLEDLVRAGLKLMREYVRKVLPSRS